MWGDVVRSNQSGDVGESGPRGPRNGGGRLRAVVVGREPLDVVVEQVDAEIRRIVDQQYALARKLLEENRDKVEAMAKALLEWETIDSDQINDIMDGKPPRPPADWDAPEPTSGDGGSSSADEKPDGKIGGPAGQH